jgi:hypothetical protein
MNLKKLLNKLHTPVWLAVLLAIVLTLRIPTFFEPYSYGDEMIYLTLGEGIRQGVPLYSGIHDNKPPLLYVLAAVAGSLFWFRAILAIWSLVTIFLFWKLSETLFSKSEALQKISTIIFAILTTIPLLEGNIANAEMFMALPIIGAFLLLFSKKQTPKNLAISGVLFSISAFFKFPAAFDMPVIVIFWLITQKLTKKSFRDIAMKTAYLLIGFLTPIFLTFVWFAINGAFQEYLVAAFLQNIGYLSSWRPTSVQDPFYIRNLPLIIRALVVLLGVLILAWKKKNLPKQFIFITIWLLMGLFAVTLSERPYPHYLIQVVPSLSLLFGILFTDKSLVQSIAVLPLLLAFFVPFYYKFWYYPTTTYYVKFAKFALGMTSKEEYFNTFADDINRNYKIADLLTKITQKQDKIFVWGDDSAIYALTRKLPPIKYVADYHINDFSTKTEVLEKLEKNPPETIIILPEAPPFEGLYDFVSSKYILISVVENAGIWKLLGPEVQGYLTP